AGNFLVQVKDFAVQLQPYYMAVDQGFSSSVSVVPLFSAGLNETITVSCPSGLPTGVTCSVVPSTMNPGDTGTLKISAAPNAILSAGTFPLTATGQLGANSASRQTSFYVSVQNFTAQASPTSASVITGGSAQFTIGARPVPNNDYNGSMALNC